MRRWGEIAVATCEEGWWVLTPEGEQGLRADGIEYAHAGAAPAELVVHADGAVVAARVDEQLTWLDPQSLTTGTVELPEGACDIAYDAAEADVLMVLASTGLLHVIDPGTGDAIQAPVEVVAGFSCSDDVRPRLATAPRLAFVSSPETGELVELDAADLTERIRYDLGGRPSRLAILGVDPRNRNAGQCFDCL